MKLQQVLGNLPRSCLNVLNNFVGLALKGLNTGKCTFTCIDNDLGENETFEILKQHKMISKITFESICKKAGQKLSRIQYP